MQDMSLPVASVRELTRAGRVLDAWQLVQSCPLQFHRWPDGSALREVAVLVGSLGAQRTRSALEWRNWRCCRRDPARFYQALFGRMRFVPLSALVPEIEEVLSTVPADASGTRADMLAMLAWIHARHRDFKPAFAMMRQALDLHGGSAWIHVEHSLVLQLADRYEEALEAARQAVALRPGYHVAVTHCAELLSQTGRDDDAIAMLAEADQATQHAAFAIRLQVFYSEREDHRAAMSCLDRIEERSPLMEPGFAKWLAGRRADFHFMAGDFDACLEWCDRAGKGFHSKLATRLREDANRLRQRMRLAVPFVRQHQMTCAPATLAAISAFWRQPGDHLEIAAAICHEGTPWHKERQWAESHGFKVREFRLTEDALHMLIDRGLPFTLTTSGVTSAHLQACVGYDARSGTVLLRDPTERHFREMFLDALLEEHPLDGPRCMLMVPQDRAALADGIELPAEAAYDANHRLHLALDTHDRAVIESALAELLKAAPDSLLALMGRASVARWKRDWLEHLAAVEALHARVPEHEQTRFRMVGALQSLGRRVELLKLLELAAGDANADPVFCSELGELLMADARDLPVAERYLKKAVRRREQEARVFESLARLRTKQHQHDEACRLRRIASCLAPDHEPYARACFDEYRALGRTGDGIAFLTERVAAHGGKAAGPWLTLAQAQQDARLDRAAAETLRKALSARPDDGELQLRAGAMMAAWGGDERGTGLEWMTRSRGRVPDTMWLREMAQTCGFLGDEAAVDHWRSLLKLLPRDEPAWRALARLVAEKQGTAAAVEMLDEATTRFPDAVPLWALKAEWLADTRRGPLEALDAALALDPKDSWLLRERALRRNAAGDTRGAEADAREAVAVNPWAPASHGILGFVLGDNGRIDEALECMKRALTLDIDYTYGARMLVSYSRSTAETARAVREIAEMMRAQISQGAIIALYQQLAWPVVAPPPLLKEIQDYSRDHPDLWQAWSARIEQALRMRLDGEAMEAAKVLTESFPLLPRAWLELARVHHAAGRHAEELAATGRAVDLSPGWDEAARTHAATLELAGNSAEAATVLRRACQLDPLNGANYGFLADLLRRNRKHEDACRVLLDGLALCPFYEWGWEALGRWAAKDGRIDALRAALRCGRDGNGHNHAWWRVEAGAWDAAGESGAALEAARQGLVLAPGDERLRDKLAYQLWVAKRHAEAMDACGPLPGETGPPRVLRARRAWLLMRCGQPLAGVAAMRELAESHPDDSLAMGELAEWHDRREEWGELRDLCLKWRRAQPNELRVLGYLGKAERALGNDDAAIEVFARAHALDPEYIFAARQLLDLQIKTGRLDDAAATLGRLEYYAEGSHITGDAIELELKRGNGDVALRRGMELIDRDDAGGDLFRWVGGLFEKSPQAAAWRKALAARMERGPAAAPGALVAYLEMLPAKTLWRDGAALIRRSPEGSSARVEGWCAMFRLLSKQSGGPKLLCQYAKSRDPELHQHPVLWNELGQSLVNVDARTAVDWFGDWRSRPEGDVTAATMVNLAASIDMLSGNDDTQWRAAGAVREEAFRRFPDGSSAQAIRAGHAFHLAADGRCDQARVVLEDYDEKSTWDYYRALGDAALAIVAADGGDESTARQRMTMAWNHLRRFEDKGSTRLRNRAIKAAARLIPKAGGREGKLLAAWGLSAPAVSSRQRAGRRTDALTGDGSDYGKLLTAVICFAILAFVSVIRHCGDDGGNVPSRYRQERDSDQPPVGFPDLRDPAHKPKLRTGEGWKTGNHLELIR